MTDRRAQILRLHARGVPAVEICVRLLVSWQAVERALRAVVDDSLNGGEAPVEAGRAAEIPVAGNEQSPPPVFAEVAPVKGERGVVSTAAPVARKGRPPRRRAASISDAEAARRQALVDEAVERGRVTRCAPGAALGWVPDWMTR